MEGMEWTEEWNDMVTSEEGMEWNGFEDGRGGGIGERKAL